MCIRGVRGGCVLVEVWVCIRAVGGGYVLGECEVH